MPLTLVSDIDGVIVNTQPARTQLLARGKWAEFAKTVMSDPPNKAIVRMIQLLYQRGIQINLVTGRGEECRDATEAWLWKYYVPYQSLLMRPVGDLRPGWQLKQGWIQASSLNPTTTFAILEDQSQTVAMYRQRGFLTLQVRKSATEDQTTLASLNRRLAALG